MHNKKRGKPKGLGEDCIDYGIGKQAFYRLLKKACQPIKDRKSDSEKP